MKRNILKLVLFGLVLIAGCIPAMADGKKNKEEMRKELQEFKIKFIAQEVGIPEDKQKLFFEIYQDMDQEKMRAFGQAFRLGKQLKKNKNATEADYEAFSKAMNEAKEQDMEIDKRYNEKFSSFMTAKQIFLMKNAEEKFRNKMHEMRHKRK